MKKNKLPKLKIADQAKIEILQSGKNTEFWRLICEAIEESKEYIDQQMEGDEINSLPADQYKFMNETFKAKKKYLDMLLQTPDNLISWMTKPPENRPKDYDPYEKE